MPTEKNWEDERKKQKVRFGSRFVRAVFSFSEADAYKLQLFAHTAFICKTMWQKRRHHLRPSILAATSVAVQTLTNSTQPDAFSNSLGDVFVGVRVLGVALGDASTDGEPTQRPWSLHSVHAFANSGQSAYPASLSAWRLRLPWRRIYFGYRKRSRRVRFCSAAK